MEKEFCTYSQALRLKALGFDEPCFANYTVIPEDEIDWFTIPGQGITGKTSFGSSKNYNSKSFEEEGTISAPTYSAAFRWFRDEYGLFVRPAAISYEDGPYLWFFEINSTTLPFGTDLGETDDFTTYEEAELACLDKLIEIVESKSE